MPEPDRKLADLLNKKVSLFKSLFDKNIAFFTDNILITEAGLKGAPASSMQNWRKDHGQYIVQANTPNYTDNLKFAESD